MSPLTNKKPAARSGQAAGHQNENRVSISPGVSRTDVGTLGLPLLQGFQKLGKTVVVETKACKHWSRVLWLQISLTTTPVYCRAVSGIPTARLGYGHVGWASFIVHRWPLRTICPGSGLLLPERDDRATRLRRSWSSHTGPVSTGRASGGPPGVRPLRYRNGSLEFRTFRGATGVRPLRHRNGPFAPSVPLCTLPYFPSVPLFSIFFFIF